MAIDRPEIRHIQSLEHLAGRKGHTNTLLYPLERLLDTFTNDRRVFEDIFTCFAKVLIGLAQASALIPGISRSGMTISAGLARGLKRTEAARFAFLLGIPVIAGAGLLQMVGALRLGEPIPATVWVGVVVAGLTGYAAIAILLRLLTRVGLAPFGVYCVTFGAIAMYVL